MNKVEQYRCLLCGGPSTAPDTSDPMSDTVCLSCGFRWTILVDDTMIYSRGDGWKYKQSGQGCLAVFSWEKVP